jgi:hypothetical protein
MPQREPAKAGWQMIRLSVVGYAQGSLKLNLHTTWSVVAAGFRLTPHMLAQCSFNILIAEAQNHVANTLLKDG